MYFSTLQGNSMKKFLLLILFSLFSLNASHSGRTDSSGCHNSSIYGYHCNHGSSTTYTPPTTTDTTTCTTRKTTRKTCASNQIRGCYGSCTTAKIGNGYCSAALNCAEFNYDGGDCSTPTTTTPTTTDTNTCTTPTTTNTAPTTSSTSDICAYGEIKNCSGFCVQKPLEVGNGYCDGLLNCANTNYDGGDCSISSTYTAPITTSTSTTQTTTNTPAVSSCSTSRITASNLCSDKECNYSTNLTTPGFYIAVVKLPWGKKEGFWGMEISTTCGVRSGFNSGAILEDDVPGFMAFYLSQAEAVNITPYEYSGLGQITIQLSKRENGNDTLVFGPTNSTSGQRHTTSLLQSGFYVAEAFSEPNVSRGRFGFEVSATSMVGGVNVGGWIDYYTGGNGEGFSGFYISESQYVGINTFFGSTYGNGGADPIGLEIYRQESNGDRTLVFSKEATQ